MAIKNHFCIVSMPRTGSNYFCDLLNSHPQIICDKEVFNRTQVYAETYENEKLSKIAWAATLFARQAAPLIFLDHVIAKSEQQWPGSFAYGFKLFPYHSRRVLDYVCRKPKFQVIYLTRKNKLLQYASDRLARQTKVWNTVSSANKQADDVKVQFDLNDFIQFVEWHRKYESKFNVRVKGKPFLSIDYADIDNSISAVLNFIGVTSTPELSSKLTKQSPNCWQQRFANPERVASALRNTEWEPMLSEYSQ